MNENLLKYVRIQGRETAYRTGMSVSIFAAVHRLQQAGLLTDEEKAVYHEIDQVWFEENLPNPPFYDDDKPGKPITWFNDYNRIYGVESMNNITIKQTTEAEIPVIEGILLDTVIWLNEMNQPLWGENEVTWDALSKNYKIDDFYIAYANGNPAGCMALVDHDPFFWPDVKRGESLFIHKLAVTRAARKSGVADALMETFKEQGAMRGAKTLRLDTHALRPKLRAFYERHGFVFIEVKIFKGDRHTAFYTYTLPDTKTG